MSSETTLPDQNGAENEKAPKVWPEFFAFQRAIMASGLTTVTRMVAIVLSRHVDVDGACWVTVPAIAEEAGCKITIAKNGDNKSRSVTDALKVLMRDGWVARTKGGTGRCPSHYQLAIPPSAPRTLAEKHKRIVAANLELAAEQKAARKAVMASREGYRAAFRAESQQRLRDYEQANGAGDAPGTVHEMHPNGAGDAPSTVHEMHPNGAGDATVTALRTSPRTTPTTAATPEAPRRVVGAFFKTQGQGQGQGQNQEQTAAPPAQSSVSRPRAGRRIIRRPPAPSPEPPADEPDPPAPASHGQDRWK